MIEHKLDGKVALVTGAARGLGRGYALRLARLGADVAIIDRNLAAAQVYQEEREQMSADTVVGELEALGVRAIGLEVDLVDRAAATQAVADIAASLGGLDIAVCNAGGGFITFADERGPEAGANDPVDLMTTGTAADCPEEMLSRVLELNIRTCMNTCMAVAPYLQRQRSGKIVTVSSTAGIDAQGDNFPYGTTKATIIHYTRSLAQELGPFNINVNAIAPGLIHTGRFGDRSHLARSIPLRRQGTVEDCAKVVEFLVTDLSDYVTGQTISVDGGMLP